MLISFSVKNFMCFKDKIEFDMQPVGSEAKLRKSELYDSNVHIAKTSYSKEFPLLSSSAVYGANASGKTNFIKAIRCMRAFIFSRYHFVTEPIRPFKLDKKSATEPSEFEITILAEDKVIYEFGFIADQDIIHKEYLYAYPKGRIQKLYERELKANTKDNPKYDYRFGTHLHGNKKIWSESTTPHRLFLATAIQLNNTQFKPIYDWFLDKVNIMQVGYAMRSRRERELSISYFNENDEQKKEIIDFLTAADLAISAIEIKEEVEEEESENETDKDVIKRFKRYEISTYHLSSDDKPIKFDIREESTGTQKMFSYSGLLLRSLKKGEVVFIDELNDNLHPLLVRYIIRLFHSKKTNPNGAQLIFTTHDPSLLHDDDLLRHDQIWFCDKNKQQSSELYSLSDFKKPRKEYVNYEARYLSGRYGAVPFVRDLSLEKEDKNA